MHRSKLRRKVALLVGLLIAVAGLLVGGTGSASAAVPYNLGPGETIYPGQDICQGPCGPTAVYYMTFDSTGHVILIKNLPGGGDEHCATWPSSGTYYSAHATYDASANILREYTSSNVQYASVNGNPAQGGSTATVDVESGYLYIGYTPVHGCP